MSAPSSRSRSDPAPADRAARDEGRRDPGADDDGPKVSGIQVLGSVLASVSGATVASLFGVAGTVLGAAVVSVVSVVGSALYVRGLRRTQRRLRELELQQRLRERLPGEGPWRLAVRTAGSRPGAGGDREGAEDGVGRPEEAGSGAGGLRALWERLGRVRWRPAVAVAVVFVASLGLITLVEAVRDEPLSGRSDGARTSIGALLGDDGGERRDTDGPQGTDGTGPGAGTDGPARPTTTVPASDGPAGGSGTGDDGPAAEDEAPVERAPGGTSTTTPTTSGGTPTTTTTLGGSDGGASDGTSGTTPDGASATGATTGGDAGSAAPSGGQTGSTASS